MIQATPRIKTIQRTVLTLLVLGGIINYVDRATLAIANPLIRQDLGLSLADMGLLLSAFLWAYAFFQLPAGALIDRFGPRLMLTISLTLWSLAQVLGGFVTSFGTFFGARVLLGVGESPMYPTCARITRDWFNVHSRGSATGIWNCSSTLGTAISAPLLTFLMLSLSWRWMFIIMGLVGIALAVAFYVLHRDPGQVGLGAEEQAYLGEGDAGERARPVTWADWRRLLEYRTTWGMIAGYFGTIYITWIYTAWLPGYLEIERHIDIKSTGWIAAVPFLFGVLGSVLGGRFADFLVRRGVSPMNSRKLPMAGSLVLTALFTVLAAETASNVVSVACISASLFLVYSSSTTAWAMAPIAAPANATASLGAMQNFGGYLGGALAPMVTGFIVQRSGSFEPAFLVAAAVAVAAATIYFLLVNAAIPPVEASPTREAAGLRPA
ncbi:MAG: MFS transporter [Acetobacteraceae bacterium]|nr:MFS transporter [Acetobacteraceae bacterium]